MVLSSKPVQRSKSLHEQTYEVLRSSILSGELAPGDRLIETQLAEQLRVSRTPIREAIRQLQREELVIGDTGSGLRVASMSIEDAAQLYDCRLVLEQLAIAGACEKASSEQLAKLEEYVLSAEALMGTESQQLNSSQLLDLDYQFHRLIAESSENRWLVTLLDQVFDKMALLRAQTTRHNPKVLEIRQEHRRIYEAIAHRQVTAATQAMQFHLTSSKVRVVQEIENLQRKSDISA